VFSIIFVFGLAFDPIRLFLNKVEEGLDISDEIESLRLCLWESLS
jgi:hypothetical protein